VEPGSKSDDPTTSISGDGTPRPFTREREPEVGGRLGQFRVEALIGRGGRGVVYRAYDDKLKRPVALKVLLEAGPSASAVRLLEEARAAAALVHSCIAAIHDVQQQEGVVFIVMELVEGETLRAELRCGPLPVATVLRYARDIASGLARAHRSSIVHRDLKPENVMITPEGQAKILDFGMARTVPDPVPAGEEAGVTGIAGTPGYMAPEQASGQRVDARADVFSFGVVLWEMLAGTRPASPPGPGASERPRVALERLAPNAPRQLVRVAERCVALEPPERFADAGQILDALRTVEAPASDRRSSSRRAPRLFFAGATAAAMATLIFTIARAVSTKSRAADPAPTSPVALKPAAFEVRSQPERLTTAELCSAYPVFADDGSIVFSQQEQKRVELHRLDLVTREETALTDDHGNSIRPARGASGQVVYMFRRRGGEGGVDLRSIPVAGGPSTLVGHGISPAFGAGLVYFVQEDERGIRIRDQTGTEDLLYEAPSSSIFGPLAVSPDGRWIATESTTVAPRPADPICFAPLGSDRAPLDCTSAGLMSSARATFPPAGDAIYFARGESIARFDLATHAIESVRVSPPPTTLTIAPDSASLVFSDCRARYEAFRLARDGRLTALPQITETNAGALVVGPHGELAFPVARGLGTALAISDPSGEHVRTLTTEEHSITEAAFSPDGRRIAFHDETRGTGGLFVIDVDGASEKVRVATDGDDSTPAWIDDEHLVYTHPEAGLPHGRVHMVSAAGGEPVALPKVPGILLGAAASRHALVLGINSPSGDRFALASLDGKVKDIPLRGADAKMHRGEALTALSPSGRYVAWLSGPSVWLADLESGAATRVDFSWPRPAVDTLQPDDQGELTISFRYGQGHLYRVIGSFP
jgi:serine/threonine protein kinase